MASAAPRVAVYDTSPYGADVLAKLRASGSFSQVDSLGTISSQDYGCQGAAPTPTLSTLEQYSAVLIYSDCPFPDPAGLGNVLADYVDQGGTVVLAMFDMNGNYGGGMSGRLASGGYMPMALAGQDQGNDMSLVPDMPDSPLLAGVTSFDGGQSSFHSTGALADGATQVAHWSGDNTPLVAFKPGPNGGNVVALNLYPPSSDARSDFWNASTDGVRLMTNALGGANAPADNTAPSITITSPTDGLVVKPGAKIDASYSCDDGSGSGVASCVGTVPNGSPIDTSNGVHTFTVTATDNAGNTATQSVTYKAVGQLREKRSNVCNGLYAGTAAEVVVPAGRTCTLEPGTHVLYDILVKKGGSLSMSGVTDGGGVEINGSAVICGSTITRAVNATQGSLTLGDGGDCAGNSIGREVTVSNARDVSIQGNRIGEWLSVSHAGATSIVGNVVGSALLVSHNGPPVDVSNNQAKTARCVANSGLTGSGNTTRGRNTCPR